MKIMILGSTGLLGNTVVKYFLENTNHEVFFTHKNEQVKLSEKSIYFDALKSDFSILQNVDYVINCIGIIKPFMINNLSNNIYINSIFPRKLADFCDQNNIRLIHITSDCVFSGKDGNYNEQDKHDCLDEYGKSKSLGEPTNCMVLRTSIIGDEIHKNASLISWAKSMKDKQVNGYINHLWNGITTKHYAEICQQIISKNLFEKNLFHVYSTDITKHDLLELISKKYNLNLKIVKHNDNISIDRRLTTKKQLVSKLDIKSISEQIKEL